MPVKFLAPIALAIVGLTTALFVNNIVLPSPTLPQNLSSLLPSLPKIDLPNLLPGFYPTPVEPQGNFAALILTATPEPTAVPLPTATPRPQPPSSQPTLPPLPPITLPPLPTGLSGLPDLFNFNLGDLFKIFNPGASPTPPPPSQPTPTPAPPILPIPPIPGLPDTIEISDAMINSLIGTFIPPNLGLSNVHLSFGEGEVVITGRLNQPIAGDFRATAGLTLQDGVPVLRLKSASFGSIPVPVFFLGSLETAANQAIRDYLSAQNIVKIKTLEIKPGKIRLSLAIN